MCVYVHTQVKNGIEPASKDTFKLLPEKEKLFLMDAGGGKTTTEIVILWASEGIHTT